MANRDKAGGLIPVQYLNGAKWNGGGRVYCIADTDDTNAYAIGDPVTLAGSADGNGIPTITLATAGTGNLVLGPIVSGAGASVFGADFGIPQDSPIVIPAVKSRNYYVLVCDDPNVIYEVQEDNDADTIVAGDIGQNINLIAGTNNGYISTWELDSSSTGSGATIQMKLLGLSQQGLPGVNAFGTYAKFLCLINHHQYRAGVAGV